MENNGRERADNGNIQKECWIVLCVDKIGRTQTCMAIKYSPAPCNSTPLKELALARPKPNCQVNLSFV